GSRLTASVDLGDGDDGWDALIQGPLASGTAAVFNVLGGNGNDVIDSTFRTNHLGNSQTVVDYQGGAGVDNIRVNAGGDVNVEAGASLMFLLDGGDGN